MGILYLGLLGSARRDVGESPGGFELKPGRIRPGQKFDASGDNPGTDQDVNGGISLPRQDFPGRLRGHELFLGVRAHDPGRDFVVGHGLIALVALILERTQGLVVQANVATLRERLVFLGLAQLHGDLIATATEFLT